MTSLANPKGDIRKVLIYQMQMKKKKKESPERRKKSGQPSHMSRALVLLSEQEGDWNPCADVGASTAEFRVWMAHQRKHTQGSL